MISVIDVAGLVLVAVACAAGFFGVIEAVRARREIRSLLSSLEGLEETLRSIDTKGSIDDEREV